VSTPAHSTSTSTRPIFRIGGSVIRNKNTDTDGAGGRGVGGEESSSEASPNLGLHNGFGMEGRTIRFPDEEPVVVRERAEV
jgi:hypothetical protein